jgi:hypothetical protein
MIVAEIIIAVDRVHDWPMAMIAWLALAAPEAA